MTTAIMEPETGSKAIEIDAASFDIRIHNVVVTASNPATGQHRTFKVKTILKDTPYAKAGTRVAMLLTGPDREDDGNWRRFGFVGHTGVIHVFKSLRGQDGNKSDWEKFAVMLAAPQRFKKLEWLLMGYCSRCNRALTHPESIASGMGPICREKDYF